MKLTIETEDVGLILAIGKLFAKQIKLKAASAFPGQSNGQPSGAGKADAPSPKRARQAASLLREVSRLRNSE